MSFHIFKYSLKSLFKDKMALFWMMIFPLILATLFNIAFETVMSSGSFDRVKIAVVTEHEIPSSLLDAMEESNLFTITPATEEEAKELLASKEITGFISNKKGLELTILSSGINQSITKVFLDSFIQISTTIVNIVEGNPLLIEKGFLDEISFNRSFTEEIPINNSMNPLVIYYFALMAMTCLYSSFAGCNFSTMLQASQNSLAARINIAPTKKLKAFLSMVTATICFQFTSVIMALTYITQVLKVDFGDRIIHIGILCLVGCFTGTMFGALFGVTTKFKPEVKDMMVSNITLVMCFLAGLMVVQVKHIVQQRAPIIALINPANLITDGLYALYFFETFERYFLNLTMLGVLGIIFCAVTILILRRQKYASISSVL